MEKNLRNTRNKGGRPQKAIKKDILIGVMVDSDQKMKLEQKATLANLCLSVYLREIGLYGSIHVKEYDKSILLFMRNLANCGSLLNQIAKKRNNFQDLDALERAHLKVIADDIAKLIDEIRATIK